MRFYERGVGYLDKLGVATKFGDRGHARIAHTRTQAADKLIYYIGEHAAVRHSAFHALGHELFRAFLEVSVFAAERHCAQASHSAVCFETSALIYLKLAGAFACACEQRAYHYGVCTRGDRFGYVAAVLDTAVADYRSAVLIRDLGAVHDSRYLRHAYTRYYARSADRAGSDTHFYHVRARLIQHFGSRGGCDVAGYDRYVRERGLDFFHSLDNVHIMPVRGVHYETVDLGGDERIGSVHIPRAVADRRADEQPAVLILCGIGVLYRLFYIFNGDKTFEIALFVDYGQFFYAVLAQNLGCLIERCADGRSYELIFGHDVLDRLIEIGLEPQIAIGKYSDELAFFGDRHARNLVLVHERERVRHLFVGV